MSDSGQYVLPNDTEICLLDCRAAFNALTPQEQLYSHYLAQAIWNGSLIVLLQTSAESPGIYLLLRKVFGSQALDKKPDCLSDEDWKAVCIYACAVYSNSGNYKAFGDTKIIPNLHKEKFELFVKGSAAYKGDPKTVQKLWERVEGAIYDLSKGKEQLGLGDNGITTYFSKNCTTKDAELCQEFMKTKNLSAYNTRLFKTTADGQDVYEVRLASVDKTTAADIGGVPLGEEAFNGVTFRVTRGDYSPLLSQCVMNLNKAKEHAANSSEKAMLDEYIKCFTSGSIDSHKEGSRHWIKDKGPIVESYIGFIESYRDPFGARGEFEGFVAMVNKKMSAKFNDLVSSAEELLPLLPWPQEYEKDTFLRPDFTSLDVLTFGGSGIPAGINIPNYDDIRQSEGFKNVSLGNVLTAAYKDNKVTFIADSELDIFKKFKIPSFEVQVGLHELLGHGSGKLFMKEADGKFNFNKTDLQNIVKGGPISTWYEANETWDTQFKTLSSTYEECRAECVGIYLATYPHILKIFGHEGDTAQDVMYVNWLNMVRAGLLSLEFYSPATGTWRQAHMQARYVILRVLLESGEGIVSVEKTEGEDGQPDLIVALDRTKIDSVGRKVIGDFLLKLQVYKSTADYDEGKKMYDHYSTVDNVTLPHFLSLRDIVMKRKTPRKMFVQCNTVIKDNKVELVEYGSNSAGLIQSWGDRFQGDEMDKILETLWDADAVYF